MNDIRVVERTQGTYQVRFYNSINLEDRIKQFKNEVMSYNVYTNNGMQANVRTANYYMFYDIKTYDEALKLAKDYLMYVNKYNSAFITFDTGDWAQDSKPIILAEVISNKEEINSIDEKNTKELNNEFRINEFSKALERVEEEKKEKKMDDYEYAKYLFSKYDVQ